VLGQVTAISIMSLRTIPQRLGASMVIVVGIAVVVAVAIGLLSLAGGFRAAMDTTARPDRALVLRAGSTPESTSYFTGDAVNQITQMEQVELASGELLMQARLARNAAVSASDVVVRAIDEHGLALRPEVNLIRGRMFEPGKDEVIVGRGLLAEYPNLDVGESVPYLNGNLQIVGHFEAAGTSTESEILMDLTSGRSAYRRSNAVNTVRVRLTGAGAVSSLQARLEQDPANNLWVLTEAEVLAEPTERRARLIEVFASWIVGIMAVGGLAAALTTMHSAIDYRTVEIGTLRALGFGQLPILVSVLLEARCCLCWGLWRAPLWWLPCSTVQKPPRQIRSPGR
jgi:putative ABC transport system permease protein